jgi:hypothetical protein
MGEPRLSNILIGILVIGILSFALVGFLGDGAQKYSVSGYENSSLSKFQDSSLQVQTIAVSVEEDSKTLSGDAGILDVFGGFVKSAWVSLQTTRNSIGIMTGVIQEGVNDIPSNNTGFNNYLRNMLIAMFIIVLIIGILLHFIRNSNRL